MELTSPLTTLTNISTPTSFYTARNSPSNAADDTGLSSPVEEPLADELPYRDAAQLPHELKSHCQIHLEEQLYSAALHILTGLLSDGAPPVSSRAKQPQTPKPARIAPPSQLALLATLVIHPSFTTRAPETGHLHAAAQALSYLRGLLSTVGPINANFSAAFSFPPSSSSSSSNRRPSPRRNRSASRTGRRRHRRTNPSRGNDDDDDDPPSTKTHSASPPASPSPSPSTTTSTPDSDSDSDADALGGAFAPTQVLFRRAPDFWAVLGWAFRCAAEYPARWRCWRAWLGLVVAALEADWDGRLLLLCGDDADGVVKGKKVGKGKGNSLLRGSLVVGYLLGLKRERRNVLREVLRAVFAFSDGEMVASDRAVFREVFERETVLGGGKSKRKRGVDSVVDLENDRFGDYLEGEELEGGEGEGEEEDGEGDDVSVPAAVGKGRRKPGRPAKGDSTPSWTVTDDIAETVPFRLRIFRLLSAVAYYIPETFAPVDELYERFTDQVRGLPLPMFRLFVAPHRTSSSSSVLPESVQVSVLRMIIEELLPHRRPDPADVDPDGAATAGVTVPILRECLLPFAANRVTAEDNAKLSLALEGLLWFVYDRIGVEYDDELRRAVEAGIKAREDKIRRRGTGAGKADAADKAAREVLARSARNLRALVDVVAVAGR